MRIEFSFDDGHVSDIRMANLLQRYGFTATFYICSCPVKGTTQMSLKEVSMLYKMGMEIGAHTMTHPQDLKLMEREAMKLDIQDNKRMLELIITKVAPVTKFCYPRGRHNEIVREVVRELGFEYARTTIVGCIDLGDCDPLQTPTTVHVFQREEYNGMDWLEYAKTIFFKSKEKGDNGYFHVWGHTAELDRDKNWEKFEELLKYINEHK